MNKIKNIKRIFDDLHSSLDLGKEIKHDENSEDKIENDIQLVNNIIHFKVIDYNLNTKNIYQFKLNHCFNNVILS